MVDQVQDKAPISQEPYIPEALTRAGVFFSVLYGIGVSLGLALLWGMEVVRNIYFRVLDRFNIKPRRRRASAFPPGQPRKRPQAPVSN
ncbi:MAG TPA: hypothetical protein VNF28_02775 [Candidatus Binataceae bacterium]|jgi:hypothetical protein|nr:hypothetical protein [Candidatus Binataceae bacterium]